ncbi:MAG TPA: HEAT repeat domain-containing protein [Candidatus Angelobacter sp.]
MAQVPQAPASVVALFEQLQSPETTDAATSELLKRASADQQTRKYLVTHLPDLIEKGPRRIQIWNNAVRIAGDLRIVEAVPALAKWIGSETGSGLITLGREARLENEPAAKALAQIGDPSVPALAQVLRGSGLRERWNALYSLKLIGSPSAKKAFQEHIGVESDPGVRDFMERALQKWK